MLLIYLDLNIGVIVNISSQMRYSGKLGFHYFNDGE